MISKSNIKQIRSLSQKKQRDELGIFIAEGTKLVTELNRAFPCLKLFATHAWISSHTIEARKIIVCEPDEFAKISELKNPQGVLGIFQKRTFPMPANEKLQSSLSLVLDNIQDPGNMGTIIRTADWFGIENIICSPTTADAYNPKVIQASMGAIARVHLHYRELTDFFADLPADMPVYGTFLHGENLYKTTLSPTGIIILGNEGNGISNEIERYVSNRITIPNFPEGSSSSESLNVAVAAAIICAEFRRNLITV